MQSVDSFNHQGVKGFRFGYHPILQPKLFVNVYFIDGLLIDTGQIHMQQAVLNCVKPLNVQQIYLTHHHEDHTGNAPTLKEYFSVKVFASPQCQQLMLAPPGISFIQKVIWGDRPAFDGIAVKTDFIETPHFKFQIIPVLGHAPDMTVLYEPNQGWLFSADLYVKSHISYFLYSESIAAQIKSIKQILQLDFGPMFCSHNPKLKNGRQALQKKLQFLEDFFGQVSDLHDKGYSIKEIFKKMGLIENYQLNFLSGGQLSQWNMVKSVIRDIDKTM